MSTLLSARYPLWKANSLAKKLTDAQKQEEMEKFRKSVKDELKKYNIT